MADTIKEIPLEELHPFPDHPFGVRDDDTMQQTVESVREYGVLVPGIARPREGGGYEIIAGHRRKHACELAERKTMPFIIRDIDQNTATIIMVDSNLQRENILPSEKAKAYKMKLEAIKRRAGRPSRNSVQVGQNFEGKTSREQIAENSPDSATQIQRYIRLTELEPELMQLVDEGKIGMTPAVEISYLKPDEQKMLIETIDSEQATPSFSQAQRMRRLSQEGKLNDDAVLGIMMEQKKPENWDLKLPMDRIRKYFLILSIGSFKSQFSGFFCSIIMPSTASSFSLPSWESRLIRCAWEKDGVACSLSMVSINIFCSSGLR